MSAAFQHLLVRWIDTFTKLSGKDYSCGINKTTAAADELQRQQTLHLELSDDHDACNELYNSINDLVNRWGLQITNIPMGTKECQEANDAYDAFITDRKLATVPADIVRRAKQLEQLLDEVSQNIKTLQASLTQNPSLMAHRLTHQLARQDHLV